MLNIIIWKFFIRLELGNYWSIQRLFKKFKNWEDLECKIYTVPLNQTMNLYLICIIFKNIHPINGKFHKIIFCRIIIFTERSTFLMSNEWLMKNIFSWQINIFYHKIIIFITTQNTNLLKLILNRIYFLFLIVGIFLLIKSTKFLTNSIYSAWTALFNFKIYYH